MILIDYDALQSLDKKYIRFPNLDENYRPMFLLESGKNLIFHDSHYHDTKSVKCSWIGTHHFNYGLNPFHIDQFAELMKRNGHTYEPESFVTDLSVYQRFFADHNLRDDNGKRIPYRILVGKGEPDYFSGKPPFMLAFCPEAEKDRQMAVIHASREDHSIRFCSCRDIEQDLADFYGAISFPALQPDPNYCNVKLEGYEQRFVTAVMEAHQRERAPGLDAQISAAKARADAVSVSGHSREEHTL